MEYCIYCGEMLPSNAEFCKSCGNKVDKIPLKPTVQPVQPNPTAFMPNPAPVVTMPPIQRPGFAPNMVRPNLPLSNAANIVGIVVAALFLIVYIWSQIVFYNSFRGYSLFSSIWNILVSMVEIAYFISFFSIRMNDAKTRNMPKITGGTNAVNIIGMVIFALPSLIALGFGTYGTLESGFRIWFSVNQSPDGYSFIGSTSGAFMCLTVVMYFLERHLLSQRKPAKNAKVKVTFADTTGLILTGIYFVMGILNSIFWEMHFVDMYNSGDYYYYHYGLKEVISGIFTRMISPTIFSLFFLLFFLERIIRAKKNKKIMEG